MTTRSSSGSSLKGSSQRRLRGGQLLVALAGQDARVGAVAGRHRVEPVVALEAARRSSRKLREHRLQLPAVLGELVLLLEDPARRVERAAVAVDERLEQHGDEAESVAPATTDSTSPRCVAGGPGSACSSPPSGRW